MFGLVAIRLGGRSYLRTIRPTQRRNLPPLNLRDEGGVAASHTGGIDDVEAAIAPARRAIRLVFGCALLGELTLSPLNIPS